MKIEIDDDCHSNHFDKQFENPDLKQLLSDDDNESIRVCRALSSNELYKIGLIRNAKLENM